MYMFRKPSSQPSPAAVGSIERVTSVLGNGITWQGSLRGSGGVRIEGAFEGEIAVQGLLVIGETGRVSCPNVRANTVIVGGALRGNITAEKVEIRSTGRVWGDVNAVSFTTEEGAFLRGQVCMEEKIELNLEEPAQPAESDSSEITAP